MGILVIVLLLAAWGLVLGPVLLKNAQDYAPMRTEAMFARALKAMSGTKRPGSMLAGRWVMVPRTRDYPEYPARKRGQSRQTSGGRVSAAERRRKNMVALAAFIIVTFLPGWLFHVQFLLVINLIADILLVAYIAAAIWFAARPVNAPADAGNAQGDVRPPEVAGGAM